MASREDTPATGMPPNVTRHVPWRSRTLERTVDVDSRRVGAVALVKTRGLGSVTIFTKNGEPLGRSGDDLFDSSGRHVARLNGTKAFGPSGRYLATLAGDRLVFRSSDSAVIGSSFARRAASGSAHGRAAGSAIWGDEPNFDR